MAKQFIISLLFISFVVGFIIGIFELVEVLRGGAYSFYYSVHIIVINAVRRLYLLSPYLILATSTYIFLRLRSTKELSALSHLGFSSAQILSGYVALLFILFLADIYGLNQFVMYLEKKLDYVKGSKIQSKKYVMDFSSQGIWLKDTDLDEQRYLYAKKIIPSLNELEDVKLVVLDQEGQLKEYLTAEKAVLKKTEWDLFNVKDLNQHQYETMHKKTVLIPSDINIFSQSYIPFGNLSQHIELFKKLGLSSDYLRLLWHKTASKFLYWVIMCLLSFIIIRSLRHYIFIYINVLLFGIGIYLMSEIIYLYTLSHYIGRFYLLWVFPIVLLSGECLFLKFYRLKKNA